ncbi:heterochromatin protein 1-like isoform X2 [Rhopalosiphum maidis]|uniref:heterochromatin protein 1-like isoform X2 n=1 Tax=Rhopalosiphum maidis TaxID=43146 RepID=UPI000F00E6A5|nr:heterochromatin protein 1-like isoform X2 [Rhopalosiphum maidis]
MSSSQKKVTKNDTDSSSSSQEQENSIVTSCASLPPEEMDVNPDDSDHDDSKHQYEAEKIIGATDVGGSLKFLVKLKGIDEAEWIPAIKANKKFPQIVLEYYYSLPIDWVQKKLNDNE